MELFFLNPIRAELTKPVLRFCGGETRWGYGGNRSIRVHGVRLIVRHQHTDARKSYACLRGQFVVAFAKSGLLGRKEIVVSEFKSFRLRWISQGSIPKCRRSGLASIWEPWADRYLVP